MFLNLIILDVPAALTKFYRHEGSTVRFAKLSDNLAESFPQQKLQRLKGFLLGKFLHGYLYNTYQSLNRS
jgi:hypothetical protein